MPRRITLLPALVAALIALSATALGGPDKFCLVCVKSNITTPLDGFFTNLCNGEIVANPDGYLHSTYFASVDGNGAIHVTSHDNVQGGTAVGMTTGERYIFNAADSLNWNNIAFAVDPVDGRAEGDLVHYVKVISPGSDDNFFVRVQQHLTIDANGVVTVLRDEQTTECR
jgi:hypothetical protein